MSLIIAGLIVAFFMLGPVVLGDCSPRCEENHEKEIAAAVGIVGLAMVAWGVVLLRRARGAS